LSPRWVKTFLVVAVCARVSPVFAQGTASAPPADAVAIHVFASASATCNVNDPPDKKNDFRVFDFKANQLVFDVADVSVVRDAAASSRLGFRFDLAAGQTEPEGSAAAGLFRDASTGDAGHVDVPQMYVRYFAPVGHDLTIDGGKFLSPFGVESIESFDAIADNSSRSILFGYTLPMTLTGARVGYAPSATVSLVGVVATGWDRFTDNNAAPTMGGRVQIAASPTVSIAVGGISGPEQRDDTRDRRTAFDFVLTWQVSPETRFAFEADEGREAHAAPGGGVANWHGYAAYLHHVLSPRVSVSLRGELMHDVDGARTGVNQQLGEFTMTPEFRLRQALRVRGELRLDRSSELVFVSNSGPRRSQLTAALNAVIVF
jgi:hypothetical protein